MTAEALAALAALAALTASSLPSCTDTRYVHVPADITPTHFSLCELLQALPLSVATVPYLPRAATPAIDSLFSKFYESTSLHE